MIIWLNGPFGGGKTTLAVALLRCLPGSVTTDPEEIGSLIRRSVGDHHTRRGDYQDYGAWRRLVGQLCVGLDRHTGGPVIVPMTLLAEEYAAEIFGVITAAGIGVRHIVLHADSRDLRSRIDRSVEFPGDAERSEKVRAFRRRKLAEYENAYVSWLRGAGETIDTTQLTPMRTLAVVLDLLRE